ncbi:hypothetical protein MLD38_001921 [Melastoma candidum]|uniref:Uncharacterized protein n=1 Tax=Melastoma candidum TaxID=119954 RepID=A0ACB9SF69_9MYRT|nr:hypothetical protein MLD38_001921 [Melastoma candidum]
MDFGSMKRKKLQALCKKHGIPANLTNLEMVHRLSSILKVPEKANDDYAREQLAESNLADYENKMDAKDGPVDAKKVRFSPENETFTFLPSNVKTAGKPKRITRSRLPGKASMKHIDSSMRSTRSRAQDLAKNVVVVDVCPVIAAKRTRCSRGRNVVENTGNNQERSDGALDAENHQIELENIVSRKRAEDNRSKGTRHTSGHFVEPFETANSSMEHQRDDRRRQRKKLELQKNNGEVFSIADKKPEDIKISGRVTRSQSMIISENSLELATISEVESQSEAGQVQQKKFPAKAVRGNSKKPGTTRKNLQGVDTGQGKSNGPESVSLMLRMESVKSQTIEPTVDPAKKAPDRRSNRKRSSLAVLGDENFPVEVVDGMNSPQKQEDSLRVEVPQKTILSEPQMGPRPAHEEPLRRSGRHSSNETQLDPALVSSETTKVKLETGSGAFISEEASSSALPSEAKSSLPGGLDHVNKLEMKNHAENSEENSDGELSVGRKMASTGDYADQKIPQLASHITMGSEQLDSFSLECERDFPVNLHNKSFPSHDIKAIVRTPYIMEFTFAAKHGGSCASLSSFCKGSEAEQLSVTKNDSYSGTVEHDDQDYWNGNQVSELGMLKPADKVDKHHPSEDEPIYGCETTPHQMRNSTLQTEASRVAAQDVLDIQAKIAGSSVVAGTHVMKNEETIEPGPQNSCPTSAFVGQGNLEGQEFALGRLEMFDEALCSERDGESLLNERLYNQNNIVEAIDKQNANQGAVLAVGPIMAVHHMDASNECPQSPPGRNSVAPRKYEAQSSGQQDGHPQGCDYASNQIPTDAWNEFLGDITSTLEGKSIDMTNRQGTPRLVENQCSDKQKVLDEFKEGFGTCSLDLHFNWGEIDGGSSVNPRTNQDASLHQRCIITEKTSDPSSFGISSVFNLLVRGDDAEACSDGHPNKEAADAHRHSMCPTRVNDDRQEHLERKYEDDIDRSGGLSGGQVYDPLRVNDVRPYFNIEPCDDYHLPEVAPDLNVETFSEAETSIDRQNYTGKKHEQENEEFSTLSRSLASVREKTGNRILHHCSIWKKVNGSGQEDMKKHKLDQIDIEGDLARLDQELLSTEVSGDHISLVQTANSGLAHSDHEKSSIKAHKSVGLPDPDIHEHTGKTPQAPLGGSFGESLEILQMGECRQRLSTPEQDAITSKDELAIASPSGPKSSKVKSFTCQDIKVIANLVDENSTTSMPSKSTRFLENCEGSTSQINHNTSSPITKLESKLTSPATLLEDIRSSKCSSVEVASVEDVQWLERALLDDTYDCTVECTGGALQQEESEEDHKNAQTCFEVGQGEIKCYAGEDLYPLFQEEEPKRDQTVQNLGSSEGKKIEDERVELTIPKFPETEKENEVGVEKTNILFGLHGSENQPIRPCVEQLSDASRDSGKQNDSHMLADEVQASDRMDESRSPQTQVGCSPVLSVVNSANQDFSKFYVRAEDLTFTCATSQISLDASNTSTDNQNVRFESKNAKEVSIQLFTPNAEEIAKDTHIDESDAEKHALADDFLAKNIEGLMDDQETTASAMIHECMGRDEEDETRTVLKFSIRHNEGQINPYSDADYPPAGTLSSENRDSAADLSSKQTARTDMAKTPLRTDPMVSDMKENMSNIHKAGASTTIGTSKTWTKRRALDPLPNR